jgi:predicted alpha/beta hydrolase family esterase
LLVSPSDLEASQYAFHITGFATIPLDKINFKTIVIECSDDIFDFNKQSIYFANGWGREFINIGNVGISIFLLVTLIESSILQFFT